MHQIAKAEITEKNIFSDFEVNRLCYNSNKVEANDIFFAIKGYNNDGNMFINEAFSKGAAAVITDSDVVSDDKRIYKVKNCRRTMAMMACRYYNYPSQKMYMIGVTGTNGKTTVTNIIDHVLKTYGKKTGLIGTNGNFINGKKYETIFTTPESVELNELLDNMYKDEVNYVIMEVSSHSLSLNRVYGQEFDTVVFTNLTPEHLDFHTDMDDYFYSKKKLFDGTDKVNIKGNRTFAVYNSDDEYGSRIVRNTASEKISVGFSDASYTADNIQMNFDGMRFNLIHNKQHIININSRLTGNFNIYNIMSAAAVLMILNVPGNIIQSAIANFEPVDGRFNLYKLKNNAVGIVDYSHTSDSLKKAILTIREIMKTSGNKGRIITVFGCGGDRDKLKRPVMGDIASRFSDFAVITSDNPRSEEPAMIINDIIKGISSDNYIIVEDRKKAIEKAYELSKKNDVILIAGKGHETYQEIKGFRYNLSDKEIILQFSA